MYTQVLFILIFNVRLLGVCAKYDTYTPLGRFVVGATVPSSTSSTPQKPPLVATYIVFYIAFSRSIKTNLYGFIKIQGGRISSWISARIHNMYGTDRRVHRCRK